MPGRHPCAHGKGARHLASKLFVLPKLPVRLALLRFTRVLLPPTPPHKVRWVDGVVHTHMTGAQPTR